jgi:hypothetical protein
MKCSITANGTHVGLVRLLTKNIKMEEEIEKKIKNLKEFIKQKTDQGTANYLSKEVRELCGMVETQALSQHDVSSALPMSEIVDCGKDGRFKLCNVCGNAKRQ